MKKPIEENSIIEKFAMEILLEKQRTRRWKIFFRLAWLALFVCLFFNLPTHYLSSFSTKHPSLELGQQNHFTAVIDLTGVIDSEHDSANKLIEGLMTAYQHPKTKAIIIRANSPGGSPVQAGIVFDEIRRLKQRYPTIPIYTVVEDICTSGCYYIASATDKIYVDKASFIGSIGVVSSGFGFVEFMKKMGVERRLYTAGKSKIINDPFSPTDQKQRIELKTLLDKVHQQFITAVKIGRGSRLQNDVNIFSGKVYLGQDGNQLGLSDGLGNVRYIAEHIIKAKTLQDFTVSDPLVDRLMQDFGILSETPSLQETLHAFFTPLR